MQIYRFDVAGVVFSYGSQKTSNPLTIKNDQQLISPYGISLKSNVKAVRIKEVIINLRSL